MPIPLLGIVVGWVAKSVITCAICGGACYCAKKTYDAYNKSSKRQKEKLALKAKTIEQTKEDNKKVQEEKDEWKKKYDELDDKMKKRDEEVKDIKNKLKDPNLPKKEREELEEKLALLIAQQDEDKKEKESILGKIGELEKRIKDNNYIISNATSSIDKKDHWILDLFTLDNILVLGGCYLLYKMVKDDK